MAKKRKTKQITEQENTLHNSLQSSTEILEIPAEVKPVIEKKKEIIEKSEICKVKYSDGLIYINFKGYGLMLPNTEGHTEPEIEVFYKGEIGKANFKFRV